MIVNMLANAFLFLMDNLIWTDIPSFPEEVTEYINQFMSFVSAGAGIVANYIPLGYCITLFGIILAIDIGISVYHLVMWVLRKIPVASIN